MPETLQAPAIEVQDLRKRLAELEQTLEAIRSGEVDAVVAEGPDGPRIYTLQTPDQPYRELVEQMSEGAASVSEQGTLLFCNKRFAEMVCQPHEKLIGAPVGILVPGPQRAAFANMLHRSLQAETSEETQFQKPDGTVVPVQVSLRRAETEGGRRICMVATDLTRLKKAEQAIKVQAYRHDVLVSTTSDGYWRCDREGALLEVNDTYCRMSGYSREELLCMNSADLEMPGTTPCAGEPLIRGRFVRCEKQHRRKDGSVFDVEISASYLQASSDLLVFVRDISQRKQAEKERDRAEEELRCMNEELECRVQQRTADLIAANSDLESFNYAVAHDLRAPLRHVSGFASLLFQEAGPALSDTARGRLLGIQRGVKRMSDLIDDLLSLSRIGRQAIRMQICGLRPLVDEVISELQPLREGRNIEWRIAELPFVECDPSLFKQVFVNLISNAIKFTAGRDPAIIEIGQAEADGESVVFIGDNGVGFDMRNAKKLFGLFQRLHRQEDFEGTGVGLAIVQRIIHRHGGRIWAEAALNRGATFYISLRSADSKDLKGTTEAQVIGG